MPQCRYFITSKSAAFSKEVSRSFISQGVMHRKVLQETKNMANKSSNIMRAKEQI